MPGDLLPSWSDATTTQDVVDIASDLFQLEPCDMSVFSSGSASISSTVPPVPVSATSLLVSYPSSGKARTARRNKRIADMRNDQAQHLAEVKHRGVQLQKAKASGTAAMQAAIRLMQLLRRDGKMK
jgi:hypothetical protein